MRGKDTVKAAIVARAMNRTMIAECVGREEAGGRKDGEDEALGVEEALASVVSGTGERRTRSNSDSEGRRAGLKSSRRCKEGRCVVRIGGKEEGAEETQGRQELKRQEAKALKLTTCHSRRL